MENSIVKKGLLPSLIASLFFLTATVDATKVHANTVDNQPTKGTQVAWWNGYYHGGYYHSYWHGYRHGYWNGYYGPGYRNIYYGPRWDRHCWRNRWGRLYCSRYY